MSWVLDQEQLHITIGATPQTGEPVGQKLDLDNELQMIKAALLYADHSVLCSVTASVLTELSTMADWSTSQMLSFFKIIPSWFPGTPTAEQANGLIEFYQRARSRRYSRKGEEDLKKFERKLAETWPVMSDDIRDVMSKLGGGEIQAASESGFLDIYNFDTPIERLVVDSQRGSFVQEYVSVVGETVSNQSTYPLFDEQTNSVISAGIRAGIIPVSEFGIARGQEVGLAADLFARLPLFSHASVNEILDIRRELENPLLRFRSAMLKFSKDIENASWDEDFGLAAENVFRQEVAPVILDIEEAVESNRFMMELTQRIVPAGAVALSALAVSMSNLPHAALAAFAIGAGVGSATIIQAYRAWAEKRQTTEQNHLYFYYRAGQLLQDGTFEYVSNRV